MTTYFTIGLVLFIINILIAFIWEKTPDDFWIRILYALFNLVAWPLNLLISILMAIFFIESGIDMIVFGTALRAVDR